MILVQNGYVHELNRFEQTVNTPKTLAIHLRYCTTFKNKSMTIELNKRNGDHTVRWDTATENRKQINKVRA